MFSSQELVNFVFAHEKDTYYTDDLLARDLNQYLWEKLHQNDFAAVYFLRAEKDAFSISTYGDLGCCEYKPKLKLLARDSAQGEWMLQQLRAKPGKAAAFVCPAEDFCAVASLSSWKNILQKMAEEKKRTGILVLTAPACPERTVPLLLKSPVFGSDRLNDTAILRLREGQQTDLYGSLKLRKPGACHFLTVPSWELLRGMLLQLLMRYPERLEGLQQLDRLSDYLYAWLKDPEAAGGELFTEALPLGYHSYASLYARLCNPLHWQRLEAGSQRYVRSEGYLPDREPISNRVCMVPDSASYAGRCMRLQLPGWTCRSQDTAEQAAALLKSIRREVITHKNQMPNAAITAEADKLLDQLHDLHEPEPEMLLQLLSALKFCTGHVYAQKGEPTTETVLDILQDYQNILQVLSQCCALRRNQAMIQSNMAVPELQNHQLWQTQQELATREKLLKTYKDVIITKELSLTAPTHESSILELQAQLSQQLDQIQTQAAPKVAPKTPAMPEPVPEPIPDGELELCDELYDIAPPELFS